MSLFVFSLKAGEFWFIYGKCEGTLTLWISGTKAKRIYLVIEFVYFLFHQPELCMGLNLSQPVLGAGGTRRPSSNRAKEITNTKVPKEAQTSK